MEGVGSKERGRREEDNSEAYQGIQKKRREREGKLKNHARTKNIALVT